MTPDRIRPGSAGANEGANEGSGDEDALSVSEQDIAEVNDEMAHVDVPARLEEATYADEQLEVFETPLTVKRGLFTRLYYGETRFDFVGRKRTWFAISAIVILAGVISLSTRGLNLGIDFVGGTSWTVPTNSSYTATQVENALGNSVTNPTVTFLGNTSTKSLTLDVEAKLQKGQSTTSVQAEETAVGEKLARLTHQSKQTVSIESVGPSWGSEITHKAVVALIVFFILIAIYISIFFEWRMAFAAIIAVLHDILVTVGIYSLTGLEVTPDTVVAFLTILGYSLYDTIVVFDRVRDNVKNLTLRDRLTYSDIVNASMNQTLARSINTSLVAIMPILAVLVLGAQILGATTLQYFGLALLVGLTTGAYSSIFIASPLVAVIKEREQRYRIIRERLESRGGGRVLLSASAMAVGAYGNDLDVQSGRSARSRAREAARASGPIRPGSGSSTEESDGQTRARPASTSPNRASATPRPPGNRPAARSRRKGRRR